MASREESRAAYEKSAAQHGVKPTEKETEAFVQRVAEMETEDGK